jgi:hypothetical protein
MGLQLKQVRFEMGLLILDPWTTVDISVCYQIMLRLIED